MSFKVINIFSTVQDYLHHHLACCFGHVLLCSKEGIMHHEELQLEGTVEIPGAVKKNSKQIRG